MYEVLRTILIEDLQLGDADVRPEADREAAGLDSLAVVELSMILTKRFAIETCGEGQAHLVTAEDGVACHGRIVAAPTRKVPDGAAPGASGTYSRSA